MLVEAEKTEPQRVVTTVRWAGERSLLKRAFGWTYGAVSGALAEAGHTPRGLHHAR